MCGKLCSGGMGDGPRTGESLRILGWGTDRGEPLDVDGLLLCKILPGEPNAAPRISVLTRRVKPAMLEARLEAVEADQRLRLRRVSLRPPELLDREWPLLCLDSGSLAGSGTFGAGRGSTKGSRRTGRDCSGGGGGGGNGGGAVWSAAMGAGGRSEDERGGLLLAAKEDDRGGLGGKGLSEAYAARGTAGTEGLLGRAGGWALSIASR